MGQDDESGIPESARNFKAPKTGEEAAKENKGKQRKYNSLQRMWHYFMLVERAEDPKVAEWMQAHGLEFGAMLEVTLPDGEVTGMEFDKSDLGTTAYADAWNKMSPEWKEEAKKPANERSEEWFNQLHIATREEGLK